VTRWTRTLAVVLFTLTIAPAFATYSPTAAYDAHCETWAADYRYPRWSYRMRQLGCNDNDVPALYEATPGYCARLARQAGRAGLRGHDVVQYVERKSDCYWQPLTRTYEVAHRTT
jgi:hypothetical protein